MSVSREELKFKELRVLALYHLSQTFEHLKSGRLAQSVLPLYFGLGDAAKIEPVEVDWPSGKTQVLTTGLEENQTLRIAEPN